MNLLKSALELANDGWEIFPCTLDRQPLLWVGAREATSDAHQITAWWLMYPHASIGVRVKSNQIVLDVDIKNGQDGLSKIQHLEQSFGKLDTLVSETGSGGRHYYFSIKEEIQIKQKRLFNGISLILTGNYVVAPPSPHPSGRFYSWLHKKPISEAPTWLIDLIKGTI